MTSTAPTPDAPATARDGQETLPHTAEHEPTTAAPQHSRSTADDEAFPDSGESPPPIDERYSRASTRPEGDAYTVTLTATRVCRFCGVEHDITPAEPVSGTLDELGEEIPAAIEAEMEELGWMDGACPRCADIRGADLHAEYHADDFRDDWE